MNHLRYSSVLLNSITENLLTTLEKQLNWCIEACFYRNKFDSSSDFKLIYDMPIRYFLNTEASICSWKFKSNLIAASLGEMKPSIAFLRKQNRTKRVYFNLKQRTDFIGKCFFKRAMALWNTPPESIETKKSAYVTAKQKIKHHFLIRFQHEAFRSELGMKRWSFYKFK